MAGLGWLFAWAKENGIDLPLEENGSVDIQKLLKLYDEWRGRRHEKASEDRPTVQKANQFNRLNTAHHQRHAREMGFANLQEYEKAAVDFFNSDKGKLYYSEARDKFYRYDEKTKLFVSSSNGVIHTYDYVSKSDFQRKIRQDKLNEQ